MASKGRSAGATHLAEVLHRMRPKQSVKWRGACDIADSAYSYVDPPLPGVERETCHIAARKKQLTESLPLTYACRALCSLPSFFSKAKVHCSGSIIE